MSCVYLREELSGKHTEDGRQLYRCLIHDRCAQEPGDGYAVCATCKDAVALADANLATEFRDPLHVTDRRSEPTTALRGMLAGGAAFLVGGGPSTRDVILQQLEQRGIFSLAVNNMAGHYRANAFVCADPPSKFHNGIWQDPSVMKFVPHPKMKDKRGRLREKVGGLFEPLMGMNGARLSACHCPNVWGFRRRGWMIPDATFFTDEGAAWGNHDSGVTRTGEPKTVCTLLLGFRLLYYLGVRRIYLVGVDFNMDPGVGLQENYVFEEDRNADAIASNNRQFKIVNRWLCKMQQDGVFSKFGLEVYNTNERSGLRAFAHTPFEMAVAAVLKDYPTEPFDLSGWYHK